LVGAQRLNRRRFLHIRQDDIFGHAGFGQPHDLRKRRGQGDARGFDRFRRGRIGIDSRLGGWFVNFDRQRLWPNLRDFGFEAGANGGPSQGYGGCDGQK
jgi:hypothetical protein